MNTDLITHERDAELDKRRRWAINDALVMLRANDLDARTVPTDLDLAYDRMLRSVLGEQARLAGVKTA